MKKPLIGITLDNEDPGQYSKFPWYAIRENYLNSVYKFGGIPFPLFHDTKSVGELSKILDGLIITGGNFDINPKLYGKNNSGSRIIKQNRTIFEISIFKKLLKLKKPILGICGGEQIINVACNGTLIQDIKKIQKKKIINHEQINPRNEVSHSITINKKTKLYKIINKFKIHVNSAHHQAVDKIGKNLLVSAIANDNIVEAIEHKNHPWCIGVQWHPEFLITQYDKILIKNFIQFA
ncbi:MAG: gamma-glutamyl-gamma-aminobutyrate hydrolase [Rickettsiales bacterium]|nr:gamma-glutamyl-gamma-aminobutyrate hydrolase [Rickettsiales bacterium]